MVIQIILESVTTVSFVFILEIFCITMGMLDFLNLNFRYMCVFASPVHLLLAKPRRACRILWNWSYRRLWASTWVLGTEPGASGRGASAVLCWAVSPSSFHEHILSIYIKNMTAKIQHSWMMKLMLVCYPTNDNSYRKYLKLECEQIILRLHVTSHKIVQTSLMTYEKKSVTHLKFHSEGKYLLPYFKASSFSQEIITF